MAESTRALSQWEIDNLLNQIPEGAPDGDIDAATAPLSHSDRSFGRVIKSYDFRRPDKFSKEQWQTLTAMHETFARIVGSQFSSRMRTLVSVRLSSIDQGLYEEWQLQLPSETACTVISMQPLAGNIVVEFNQDVATEAVDRLLGGTATLPVRDREMTDIEMVLLRSFARAVTAALTEMWANIVPVEPALEDLGFDVSLIQIAGANDVVVTAFFEVNLGNRLGAMSICTPYTVLEQVASKLSAQVWRSQGLASAGDASAMRSLLGAAPLELSVELGATEVPARVVVDLHEGDTLVLDARVDRPMSLLVGGARRFLVRPGMVGNRVAVRVSDAVMPRSYDGHDAIVTPIPTAVPVGGALTTIAALDGVDDDMQLEDAYKETSDAA